MLRLFRNPIPVAFFVFFLAISSLKAQTSSVASSAIGATGRNEGLTLNINRPVSLKPKALRVVFQFKAEDATSDKAIEKISSHMKTIQAALTELGATANSLEFAEIETNPSNPISYAGVQGQVAWAVNGALPNAFQAVQIAPAMPLQAIPAARLTPAMQRGEPTKTLPTFVIATSAVSVDWNIEGKSTVEIAVMKPKLLAAIAKQNLDGRDLVHKFTPEQEDEIFEITKIDIRNGDTRSLFNHSVPAPRVFFIGYVAESDNAEAMKSAFQTAEKMATQMAKAGNLKLGKAESVNVSLSSRYASAGLSYPVAYPYSSPYPGNSASLPNSSLNDWEPLNATGEIRMDSLNQLKQSLNLTVRYRVE